MGNCVRRETGIEHDDDKDKQNQDKTEVIIENIVKQF